MKKMKNKLSLLPMLSRIEKQGSDIFEETADLKIKFY